MMDSLSDSVRSRNLGLGSDVISLALLCPVFVMSAVCYVLCLLCPVFVMSAVCCVRCLLCPLFDMSTVCYVRHLLCPVFVMSSVCYVHCLSVQGLKYYLTIILMWKYLPVRFESCPSVKVDQGLLHHRGQAADNVLAGLE